MENLRHGDGVEYIKIPPGHFAITITNEFRVPGEYLCPDDSEVSAGPERMRQIPKRLSGLEGEELREALQRIYI